MMDPKIKKVVDELKQNKILRKAVTSNSHFWFFFTYFGEHIKYLTAPFQKEILNLVQDENNKFLLIAAFRGSAKSTICNLSFPIWAMVGKQQKKFILTLAQTQAQAKQHLDNIKREFEKNDLLRGDYGPFEEPKDEWRSGSVILSNYGAKIIAASTEEAIRGIKYRNYRPQIIISDDLENLTSVKTQASRDKLFQWYASTIIPAGDADTRFILVGTYLHEDSLLKRFKDKIKKEELPGLVREYPLLDKKDKIAWPGKFPNKKAILELKASMADEISWLREMLLQTISDTERVIHLKWIKYYDNLPDRSRFLFNMLSVDLAISQEEGTSYTAIVTVAVYSVNERMLFYVLPNPVNKRMTGPQAEMKIKELTNLLGSASTKIVIEDVGYQRSVIERLQNEGYDVTGFKPSGRSKKERLAATGMIFYKGQVLFPKDGCKDLINQTVNLGKEKYNDLVDALSMLILQVSKETANRPRLTII